MAEEGHSYRQIINFYYSDIIITDFKNAVTPPNSPYATSTPLK